MQKGKGKALRNFSLALFSLVLKQDSANRMEAYMQHAICGKKLQTVKGSDKGSNRKKEVRNLTVSDFSVAAGEGFEFASRRKML